MRDSANNKANQPRTEGDRSELLSPLVGSRYPPFPTYGTKKLSKTNSSKNNEEVDGDATQTERKSSAQAQRPSNKMAIRKLPSAPKLNSFKIYGEKTQEDLEREAEAAKPKTPGMTQIGSVAPVQDIWAQFSTMEDAHRNLLLQGLLERCTVAQTDFICGAMNLKFSKNALLGNSTLHPHDQYARMERHNPRKNFSNFGGDITELVGQPKMRSDYEQFSRRSIPSGMDAATVVSSSASRPSTKSDTSRVTNKSTSRAVKSSYETLHQNPDVYLKMLQDHEMQKDKVDNQLKNATPEVLRRHIEFLKLRQSKYRSIFETITEVTRETNFQKAVRDLFAASRKCLNAKDATVYLFAQKSDGMDLTVHESTWLPEKSRIPRSQLFRNEQLAQGLSYNMYNVEQSEEYLTSISEQYASIKMECILAVPIVAPKTQQIVGILEFINKNSGPPVFEAEDESLLSLFSAFWVFILGNTQLREGSGANTQAYTAFQNIAGSMFKNWSNLEELVQSLESATCSLIRCQTTQTFSYNKTSGTIQSLRPSLSQSTTMRTDKPSIPGFVACSGMNVNSFDPQTDSRFGTAKELAKTYANVRNVVAVPLRDRDNQIIGVVQCTNKLPNTASFDKDDEELLESFAGLVSAVVDRAKEMLNMTEQLKKAAAMNEFYQFAMGSFPMLVLAVSKDGYLTMINRPNELGVDVGGSGIKLDVIIMDEDFLANVQNVISTGRRIRLFNVDVKVGGRVKAVHYSIQSCKEGATKQPLIDGTRFQGYKAKNQDGTIESSDPDILILLEEITDAVENATAITQAFPYIPYRTMISSETEELDSKWEHLLRGGNHNITVLRIVFQYAQLFTKESLNATATMIMLEEFHSMVDAIVRSEGGINIASVNNQLTTFFMDPPSGKPEDPKAAAYRAAVCALKVKSALLQWALTYSGTMGPIDVYVALTSGEAVVGFMGPPKQRQLSVHGGPMALLDTVEAAARQYSLTVSIDATTSSLVPSNVYLREIDSVIPTYASLNRGAEDQPEKVYELVSVGELSQERSGNLTSYAAGLKEYREMNWNSATIQFKKAMTLFPEDQAARVMYARCDKIQREAIPMPAYWNGTWPIPQENDKEGA